MFWERFPAGGRKQESFNPGVFKTRKRCLFAEIGYRCLILTQTEKGNKKSPDVSPGNVCGY